MRILVTGITGFAGSHLAETLLTEAGVELHGTSRRGSWSNELRSLKDRVTLHRCDLATERSAFERLLRDVEPERIYHLAGFANTGKSFREIDEAWHGNLTATRALFDAVHAWGGKPRILFVGSGLIYGQVGDKPIKEDEPLRPASPYAASKAAADLASFQYTRFPGLDIVRARPFNHVGPRQAADYALANFAWQIAAIEAGKHEPFVETGDLSARRDLTDVRDTVRAYRLLVQHGKSGEAYNVATGTTHSMQECLDRLVALARVKVEVRTRDDLKRAVDNPVIRGDAARLRRDTGWEPRFRLEQTLADILDYWRATLSGGNA